MAEALPVRVVIFGVTGHLGQDLVSCLEHAPFKIETIEGVVSEGSAESGSEFEFRGEVFDAHSKWPTLRKDDLVFVCTPASVAPDVIRAALRAEARCIDCSAALAAQPEVFVPTGLGGEEEDQRAAASPLICLPAPSLLAWSRLLSALREGPGLSRLVATVLCGASSQGRDGLIALSEESIAVFNQGESPEFGPAGQAVAFDVVPGVLNEVSIEAQAQRLFGEDLRVSVTTMQVPAFVGEGAALAFELKTPLAQEALRELLEANDGLTWTAEGPGSRGLVAIDSAEVQSAAAETLGTAVKGPFGPTLRDAIGQSDVSAGRLRPDPSMAEGLGYRVWLTYDPSRLTADFAVRLAGLGAA